MPATEETTEGNAVVNDTISDDQNDVAEDKTTNSPSQTNPTEETIDPANNEHDGHQKDSKDSKPAIQRTDSHIQAEPKANASSYSHAFFCPITDDIMENPVVAPDGVSYERQAIEETKRFDKSKLYPNRALRNIMDKRIQMTGSSLRARTLRMDHAVKQSLRQLWDKSLIPSPEYRPLADDFYCTITLELMHVPVIDPDGNTFEKAAILNWIRSNGNSPISRKPLSGDDLYPNKAIMALLEEEKSKPEEAMHPSIRKFKDAKAPEYDGDEEEGYDSANHSLDPDGGPPRFRRPIEPSGRFLGGDEEEGVEETPDASNCCTASSFTIFLLLTVFAVLFIYAPVLAICCCCFGCLFWCRSQKEDA